MKTFKIKMNKTNYKVGLNIGRYSNGLLAIMLTDYSEGYAQPYGNLTVNLVDYPPQDTMSAYLNSDVCTDFARILVENNLGYPTGNVVEVYGCGGKVTFPEFKFDEKELESYDEDGFEEYKAYSEALVELGMWESGLKNSDM